MNTRLLFILLFALVCTGCGKSGPKQTLVFKATPLAGATGPIDMETAKLAVNSRVGAAKTGKSFRVSISATNDVEVAVYGAEQKDLERIKSFVTQAGMLEFAALAHVNVAEDIDELAKNAEQEVLVDGVVKGEWLPVAAAAIAGEKRDFERFQQPSSLVAREKTVDGKTVTQWLVVYVPDERITGNLLQAARQEMDEAGRPCIDFTLDAEGAAYMQLLSSTLKPQGAISRRMAIVFDGEIISAPMVRSAFGARGMISGDFTLNETERMVALLQSRLPCQLTFEKIVDNDAQ